jgi:hypothetical protein
MTPDVAMLALLFVLGCYGIYIGLKAQGGNK